MVATWRVQRCRGNDGPITRRDGFLKCNRRMVRGEWLGKNFWKSTHDHWWEHWQLLKWFKNRKKQIHASGIPSCSDQVSKTNIWSPETNVLTIVIGRGTAIDSLVCCYQSGKFAFYFHLQAQGRRSFGVSNFFRKRCAMDALHESHSLC